MEGPLVTFESAANRLSYIVQIPGIDTVTLYWSQNRKAYFCGQLSEVNTFRAEHAHESDTIIASVTEEQLAILMVQYAKAHNLDILPTPAPV